MDDTRPRVLRRNFTLGILNGALVNFGLAFIDPFTVLPVFITRLGGSSFLVGLATAVYSAGWFLPQLFTSRIVASRPRVLNIYRLMSLFRVLTWACVAAVVFFIDPANAGLFIAGVVGFMMMNAVCAGIAGVPFLEITSKMIPVERRGSFFGSRRLLGGLLGILAGVVVAAVLDARSTLPWASGWFYQWVEGAAGALGLLGHAFPYDYGVLIVVGAAIGSIGLGLFGGIAESPARVVDPLRPLREHIRMGFALLREQPNYRLFFVVRVCWQLTAMAFPFYAAYAYDTLGFSEASVGVFVSIWLGSGVVSNYVWGHLADRSGNRIVLVLTGVIGLVAPLVVLLARGVDSQGMFWIVAATFLLNGFARSGRFISNMTYLLEAAPEERRPLYVGFMNTLSFPFMLSPALGGVIVQLFSYRTLFMLSAVFAVVNIILSTRLFEPRRQRAVVQSVEMP